jgi:hypothetical protein
VTLVPHKQYTLKFLLSGDSACRRKRSNSLKAMIVFVSDQWQVFIWDTAHGNDAQHGAWGAESFTFVAQRPTTLVQFKSMDFELSDCGPVIAAASLAQN